MRRWDVRRRAAAVALGTLLGSGVLAGCSEGDADQADQAVEDAQDRASELAGEASDQLEGLDSVELPDVDWNQYGDRLRDRLDRLAERADCEGLEQELERVEGLDAELTEYVKRQIARVC